MQTDRRIEFTGLAFQELLQRREIQFRVTRNLDIKAAVVERLNRTLRERIWRYFSHNNTNRYIDIVQKIVHAYNRTLHSGTHMRPIHVTLYNASTTSENLAKRAHYNYRRRVTLLPKFKVGNLVCISRTKNTFEKGYEKNFREEVFKIITVSTRQNLYTYVLEDLNEEIIDGFFYPEKLVLVGRERLAPDKCFKVERVIRTEGRGAKKRALVKWLGYPDESNSWVKASELEDI